MAATKQSEDHLAYRFDPDKDIPWDQYGLPGVYFPRQFLEKFCFNHIILDDPKLRQALDWAWALTHCYNFVTLEQVIIKFISNKDHGVVTTERSDHLIVEEGKHVKVYRKFAKLLEKQNPEWAQLFHSVYCSPTSVDAFYKYLQVDEEYFRSNIQYQYLFWLNTVYFEDYTIYLHEELEKYGAGDIQPTWLTLNKVHRQEEQEHVITDDFYLESLDIDHTDRANIMKIFYMNQRSHYTESLGIATAARFLQKLVKDDQLKVLDELEFEQMVFFQDLKSHPLFETTRKWAPLVELL